MSYNQFESMDPHGRRVIVGFKEERSKEFARSAFKNASGMTDKSGMYEGEISVRRKTDNQISVLRQLAANNVPYLSQTWDEQFDKWVQDDHRTVVTVLGEDDAEHNADDANNQDLTAGQVNDANDVGGGQMGDSVQEAEDESVVTAVLGEHDAVDDSKTEHDADDADVLAAAQVNDANDVGGGQMDGDLQESEASSETTKEGGTSPPATFRDQVVGHELINEEVNSALKTMEAELATAKDDIAKLGTDLATAKDDIAKLNTNIAVLHEQLSKACQSADTN